MLERFKHKIGRILKGIGRSFQYTKKVFWNYDDQYEEAEDILVYQMTRLRENLKDSCLGTRVRKVNQIDLALRLYEVATREYGLIYTSIPCDVNTKNKEQWLRRINQPEEQDDPHALKAEKARYLFYRVIYTYGPSWWY